MSIEGGLIAGFFGTGGGRGGLKLSVKIYHLSFVSFARLATRAFAKCLATEP